MIHLLLKTLTFYGSSAFAIVEEGQFAETIARTHGVEVLPIPPYLILTLWNGQKNRPRKIRIKSFFLFQWL